MSSNHLNTSFQLPCGATIKNRLVKSAMTERVSNPQLEPNEKLHRIYKLWADTEAGLIITGNVMVDPVHMESAGNVYAGDDAIIPKMKAWADVAKKNDNHVWVQISNAGRQTNRMLSLHPISASDIQLHKNALFGKPRPMTEEEIQDIIQRFVKTASICKASGFTGVQIHAAHGYLISQFLSPITNKRTDKWGGSIENRSRLLLTIIDETRKAVGPSFPISIKLNSSDFQKGGFSEDDSLHVIKSLEGKIDLLEISGGTYEKIVFLESNTEPGTLKESTKKREAYFIEFSEKIRAISNIPLLITGGFRSFDFCNEVLANKELDFVGMARPFITNIADIRDFIKGKIEKLENLIVRTGIKVIDETSEGGFYAKQLVRLGDGKEVNLKLSAFNGAMFFLIHETKKTFMKRKKR